MNGDKEIYEVLEHEDYKGLTVGSFSLAPGRTFSRSQWPYTQGALDVALKNKRCKLVSDKKAPEKPAEKKDGK